jgi:hypothetical protein
MRIFVYLYELILITNLINQNTKYYLIKNVCVYIYQ